jgi:8-oxo-dGTP pyrophosphatase MutT (NUDIX family)
MRRFLLQVWRILPLWLQMVLSRIIRPLFQVFAAAVIFNDEHKVLLVKMTYQQYHPWGMPGGSLEYSETAEEGVVREVHEETGLEVEIDKLLSRLVIFNPAMKFQNMVIFRWQICQMSDRSMLDLSIKFFR